MFPPPPAVSAITARLRSAQAPFGKDCLRCGKWRAFVRWSYETHCGDLHDLVCNYCHYDAHIQSHLPVIDELRKLAELEDPHGDEDMVTEPYDLADEEMAIELDLDESSFLRNLLEEERRRVDGGAEERKEELRSFISARESELADDDKINEIYENYVVSLPLWERPRPGRQTHLLYGEWEGDMRQELAAKRDELAKPEAQPVHKQLIIDNARTGLLQLFEGAARDAGLLPPKPIREVPERWSVSVSSSPVATDSGEWITFVQLAKLENVAHSIIEGSFVRECRQLHISVIAYFRHSRGGGNPESAPTVWYSVPNLSGSRLSPE